MGGAITAPPTLTCHRSTPVDASSAKTYPSMLPPNSSPPAEARRPDVDLDATGNSHTRRPVNGSSALTALIPALAGSSSLAAPPRYIDPRAYVSSLSLL